MSERREKLRRGTGECRSVQEDGRGQVICPMMSRYMTEPKLLGSLDLWISRVFQSLSQSPVISQDRTHFPDEVVASKQQRLSVVASTGDAM